MLVLWVFSLEGVVWFRSYAALGYVTFESVFLFFKNIERCQVRIMTFHELWSKVVKWLQKTDVVPSENGNSIFVSLVG